MTGEAHNRLSQAIAIQREKNGLYTWLPTQDWTQGRTVFGGIVVGAMVEALQRELPKERILRTLLATFVGPVVAEPARIETQILRAGKTMTHAEARLYQGDQLCTTVTGSFGSAHEKYLSVEPLAAPQLTPPNELPEMPFMEGVMPTFTQHLAVRWTTDTFPFSGSPKPNNQGWCRWRDTENLRLPGLVALLDAWPPPILSVSDGPLKVSSINWMINFFSDLPEEGVSPDEWWLYESQISGTNEGFSDCSALLWDRRGRLYARSTQHVVDFVR